MTSAKSSAVFSQVESDSRPQLRTTSELSDIHATIRSVVAPPDSPYPTNQK